MTSDAIGRLARRTLGDDLGVRPRTATLFEPAADQVADPSPWQPARPLAAPGAQRRTAVTAPGGDGLLPPPVTAVPTGFPAAPEAAPPASGPRHPTPPAPAATAHAVTTAADRAAPAAGAPSAWRAQQPRRAAPPSATRSRPAALPRPLVAANGAERSTRNAPAPLPDADGGVGPQPPQDTPVGGESQAPPDAPVGGESQAPPAVPVGRPPAPSPAAHDPARSPARPPLSPVSPGARDAGAAAASVPLAAEPAGPSEPPAVSIHIGRVEVRAVTAQQPPAPTPAPRAPAAVFVSLDDYLRGERRGRP